MPPSVVVQPNSTASLDVAYRPLLAAESAATLKLTSKELGLYQYALRLKGAPAGPERSMAFSVALGNTETQVGCGRCRQPPVTCTHTQKCSGFRVRGDSHVLCWACLVAAPADTLSGGLAFWATS